MVSDLCIRIVKGLLFIRRIRGLLNMEALTVLDYNIKGQQIEKIPAKQVEEIVGIAGKAKLLERSVLIYSSLEKGWHLGGYVFALGLPFQD
ncbi:uncharacterized protein LOC141611978 isoform X2 [Silene latifolia]|uniref:uncharacterized protein LOC141611978 isoform X2 n=1 Tax=Silene latifolia TaxID=37657 RepID=UPI003D78645B